MISEPESRTLAQTLAMNDSSAGKEGEIDAFQMLGQNCLDEGRLVVDLIQLAERVFLIQQLDVDGGKVALAQDIADFLALQRGRADQGDGEQIGLFGGVAHEAWGTSLRRSRRRRGAVAPEGIGEPGNDSRRHVGDGDAEEHETMEIPDGGDEWCPGARTGARPGGCRN